MVQLKMFMKKRIGLVLVLILILNFCVLVSAPPGDKKDLDYYSYGEKLNEFRELGFEERNKLWEESEEGKSYILRETIVNELAERIALERYADDLQTGRLKLVAETWISAYFDKGGTIPGAEGVKLDIKSYDEIKEIVRRTTGKDLDDYLGAKIENVEGFGSKDLKWYGDKKNIIGNGKVWLDLDKLPRGVSEIEYDERKGVFVLRYKEGGQIVLGEGATKEDGSLNFLAGLSEDSLLRKAILPLIGGDLGLDNLRILDNKGEVIITEDGFEIKGEGTRVQYGNFIFGRKKGEASGESVVKFSNDRVVLRGVEFERSGYVKVGSTTEDFIVHFGGLGPAKIGSGDIPVYSGESESLAREISFEDRTSKTDSGSKINFRFDSSGQLSGIKKEGVSSGEWIPISKGVEWSDNLKKFYLSSGKAVKEMLTEAQASGISSNKVGQRFYQDDVLKYNGQRINIDSYQANFLSMVGENIVVGGQGNAEILKKFNSLVGVDTGLRNTNKGFQIKNQDMLLGFSGKKMGVKFVGVKNFYDIGKFYIEGNTDPNQEYVISHNNPEGKIVSVSKTFTAGRETYLGPYGTSIDVRVEIDQSELGKLQERVESKDMLDKTPREELNRGLIGSEFKLSIDAYAPLEGVSFKTDKEKIIRILDDNVFTLLKASFTLPEEFPIAEKDRQVREEKLSQIRDLVLDSIPENARIENGRVSLEIENNPSGHPVLVLSSNGKPISRTEVKNFQQANIVLDVLGGALRVPEVEKGVVEIGSIGVEARIPFAITLIQNNDVLEKRVRDWWADKPIKKESYYSTRPYLQRLWYNQFGRGSERFDNLAGLDDLIYFRNVIEQYTEPKK